MKTSNLLPFILSLTTTLSILTSNAYAQNGISLDGVNDYIQTTSNGVLAATDRTFEAWIYLPSAPSSTMAILDYGLNAVGSRNTFIINNNLGFGFVSGGTNANISSPQNIIPIGQWTHLALVLDNGTGFLYLNGNQVGTGSLSSVFTPLGTNVRIGQRVSGGSIPFKGNIDEVRVWSVAKTQQELMANMNQELCSITSDLVVYYRMNQGIAGGNNSGLTTLDDLSNNNDDGTLINYALSGATSNWVTGATLNGGSTTGTDVQSACNTFTWIDGNAYTSSNNTATFMLTNTAGCDSVVTLDLTINTPTTSTDVQATCDTFTWIDGNTYTSANNTATFTLTNAAGCDSVVTLDLTINTPTTGTDVQATCDTFTWIDGNTYTSANNTATFTLTNAAGCDSVVTLDLTINTPTTGTDIQTACDTFTWIDRNTYTSANNTATFTLTNAAGCDSVVTLDLTINNSSTSTDVQSACNTFTWIDGNTYTSANNTATFTLTNAVGCDSVVTLNLTINRADTTTTMMGNVLTANAVGATYQWLDCGNNNAPIAGATLQTFSPTNNGNYAVMVTQNGCVDTSSCQLFARLGTNQLSSTTSITIYPNPTTGTIALDFGEYEAQNATINVYSIDGKLLLQQTNVQGSLYQLDLPNPTGVYIVEIQSAEQVSYHQLIKQ